MERVEQGKEKVEDDSTCTPLSEYSSSSSSSHRSNEEISQSLQAKND